MIPPRVCVYSNSRNAVPRVAQPPLPHTPGAVRPSVIPPLKDLCVINTGWERTVHVSRCPALYSGRIFVQLSRELIIFVF